MKALLVIDYIKGIVESGTYPAYMSKHPELLVNTNQLIASFREHNLPIVFIRLAFDPQYIGLPKYFPKRQFFIDNKKFQLDSHETDFIDSLDFNPKADCVLNKKCGDVFMGSGLHEHLQALGVDEIVMTGVATNNAIATGATTAMNNDYKVIVITDACGASTSENHEMGLEFMNAAALVNNFYPTADYLAIMAKEAS